MKQGEVKEKSEDNLGFNIYQLSYNLIQKW